MDRRGGRTRDHRTLGGFERAVLLLATVGLWSVVVTLAMRSKTFVPYNGATVGAMVVPICIPAVLSAVLQRWYLAVGVVVYCVVEGIVLHVEVAALEAGACRGDGLCPTRLVYAPFAAVAAYAWFGTAIWILDRRISRGHGEG